MAHRSTRATAALFSSLLLAVLVIRESPARADPADEVARAQAEYIREHGDRTIAAIRIEGLQRTRPQVVQQWIDCAAGEPLSRCDLPQIRERIYRLAIFSDVELALEEAPDGVAVVFRIEEKWTLYPVPMLWYSPGTEIAGVILVESNLLGLNKGVALGGVYSNRGWYTLAGYNDPNIGYTSLWGSLHGFLGSTQLENQRPDGAVLQSFDLVRFDLEAVVGWTFWDRVSPCWTGGLRVARVGEIFVPGSEAARDATVTLQGVSVIYSDRRYRYLYDEGLRLSVDLQHAFPLSATTRPYDDAFADAKWTHPAPLDGFLDVRAHAFVGSLPVSLEERLGGLDGSRTLPGSGLVAADRYASLSADYQVPFLTLKPGTATAGIFGEIGQYARNDEPGVTYGGPGVALRLFLKRVAIPAVGVDAGYEVGSEHVRVSVSVGYRPVR